MDTKNDLINDLVFIGKDYQKLNFNQLHVVNWLNQFPIATHEVLLKNLVSMLGKTYFSKSKIEDFFLCSLKDNRIFSQSIEFYSFLDIQDKGNSQKDMLEIMNKQSNNLFSKNIKISNFDTDNNYIYLDDAIYSGTTLKWDIIKWADTIPDKNSKINLTVLTIGIHHRNLEYIKSEISKKLPNVNISFWGSIIFDDFKTRFPLSYDSYLPPDVNYSNDVVGYIKTIDSKRSSKAVLYYPLLREKNKTLNDIYFTSLVDRNIVEAIFFEKGVKISDGAKKKNMRPMGYDNNHTLGFGSYLVTYRNIANNCPLVLWWGDVNGHKGISNWYPLFPRTVNN